MKEKNTECAGKGGEGSRGLGPMGLQGPLARGRRGNHPKKGPSGTINKKAGKGPPVEQGSEGVE